MNAKKNAAGRGRPAEQTPASVGRRHGTAPAGLMLCACLLACLLGLAPAAETAAGGLWPVTLGAGSELWIEGTSTLHPWSSRTDTLGLSFELAPGAPRPGSTSTLSEFVRAQTIRGAVVEVSVRSLRSKESRLDRNLWRAMQADEYPIVRFEMSGYAASPAPAGGDTLGIRVRGVLTVHGVARPIELAATLHARAEGLWLSGTQEVAMSEYGIRPPTMMLGTLRVGDRVQVHYQLLLVPGVAGVPATAASRDEKGVRR